MPVSKQSAVAAILAKSEKKYDLSAGPLSEIALPSKFITTGNLAIDHIIGGGMPLGRSVELSGPPSSGKSTTALQAMAELQGVIKSGGDPARGITPDDFILYMDYEQTIDAEYAAGLGLDVNDSSFILTQPETFEQGSNFALELINTGAIRCVTWDSVPSMTPSARAAAEVGKSLPAVQAKLMAEFGQVLNPILVKNNTLNIWINHLKEIIQMGGYSRPGAGPRMGTGGGVAMKFYASVRVEYRQLGKIKATVIDSLTNLPTEQVVAQDVLVKVTKNKVAPPFREAKVRVRFGTGFDNFWSAMQVLAAYKEIIVAAGYYKFHRVEERGLAPEWMERMKTGTKPPVIHGAANLDTAAAEHPEWAAAIVALAEEVLTRDPDELKKAAASTDSEESDEDEEESRGSGVLTDEALEDLLS